MGVLGEDLVLVADDQLVFGLPDPNFPSGVFDRRRVPAAGVGHETVPGNPPALEDQRAVGGHASHRTESFTWQAVDRTLAGRAMDSDVAGLIQPTAAKLEQVMCKSVVAYPWPEVLAHVADPVLGLAFGLWSVGMAESGSVAVVAGEVEQTRMKDGVAAVVVTKPHRLGPVVEDFFWHAAVVMEGTLMTGEEKSQRLGVSEVEVHRARPAQRHDKALHPLSAWLLEHAPVHLRLLTRSRLESFCGLVRRHLTEWRHELFEDAAAALIALLPNLVEEHLGVGHRILAQHARQQVLAEAVQL